MDMDIIISELSTLSSSALTQIFFALVVLDILTGFLSAKIAGDFTSREAVNGLMRQMLRICVFVTAVFFKTFLGDGQLLIVVLTIQSGFCVAYARSIFENYKKAENAKEFETEEE